MKFEKEQISPEEVIAIKLHEFIGDYQPSCWKEKIKTVAFAPRFIPDEARQLLEWHKNNSLEENIDSFLEGLRGGIYKKKWFIKEAIIEFFKQNKHN